MTEASEKAWTKGPWTTDEDGIFVFGPNMVMVAEMRGAGANLPQEANAHLIAAAPEMYDKLFRALAALRVPQAFDLEGVTADIERVLAKARGERIEKTPQGICDRCGAEKETKK